MLWKLVTGSSVGLGRHARVPEQDTESERSNELLRRGERKDGDFRGENMCDGIEGPDAALEAEPYGWSTVGRGWDGRMAGEEKQARWKRRRGQRMRALEA